MSAHDYEIRPYRAGDELALLAAFNRACAHADARFRARSLAEWRWRFGDNPGGARIMLALDSAGAVVAQYAGLARRMRIEGELVGASQSVDSFVLPEHRALAHKGLFVAVGERYAAEFGGRGGDELMWGLPVRSAWRIGRRALGYEGLRSVMKLVATPSDARAPGEVSIDEVATMPAGVDELCERVASEHRASCVRDRAHLEWRFARRPGVRYAIALARSARELRGIAVARAAEFDGEDAMLLCEWLVPRDDELAAVALRAWLAEQARSHACPRMCAHFPETSPQFLQFQRAGWRVRPTRYPLVARSYSRRVDLDRLRDGWYLTLGDTDLV